MAEPTEADRAEAYAIHLELNSEACDHAGCPSCGLIADTRAQARADRDMEWWTAVCLVDSVAPTPAAVKAWLLELSKHEQEEARRDRG